MTDTNGDVVFPTNFVWQGGGIDTNAIAKVNGIGNDTSLTNPILTGATADSITFPDGTQTNAYKGLGFTLVQPVPGTDITLELNAALTNGGLVRLPGPGTFEITNTLIIPTETTLELGEGVIIQRAADINAMILVQNDGTQGGYTAGTNITLRGGTWDLNRDAWPNNCTGIALGHTTGTLIERVTVMNGPGTWHLIEMNSSIDWVIRKCTLLRGSASEAIQYDSDYGAGFPWPAPHDDTSCLNGLITECHFEDFTHGIGNHANVGNLHQNIQIIDNYFTNFTGSAIGTYWDEYQIIERNRIVCGYRGISQDYTGNPGVLRRGMVIRDNKIYGMTNGLTQARGIIIKYDQDAIVENNELDNIARHGIGVDEPSLRTRVIGNTVKNVGILASAGYGIWDYGATESVIERNTVTNTYNDNIALGQGGGTYSQSTRLINNRTPNGSIRFVRATNFIATGNEAVNIYVDTATLLKGSTLNNNRGTWTFNGQTINNDSLVVGNYEDGLLRTRTMETPTQFKDLLFNMDFDGVSPYQDRISGELMLNGQSEWTNIFRASGIRGLGAMSYAQRFLAPTYAPSIDNSNGFSTMLWVKIPPGSSITGPTVPAVFMSQYNTLTNSSWLWGSAQSDLSYLRLLLTHYTNSTLVQFPYGLIPPTPYTNGAWHHLAATWNTNSGVRLYMDGDPIYTNTDATLPILAPSNFRIALVGSISAGNSVTNAVYDEFKLFGRALSASEISAIYQADSGKNATLNLLSVGNARSLTNYPVTNLATNTGSDGQVLSLTGTKGKWVDQSGGSGSGGGTNPASYATMYWTGTNTTALGTATPALFSGTTAQMGPKTSDFTVSSGNRITYTGSNAVPVQVHVALNIANAGVGATVGTFYLYTNGVAAAPIRRVKAFSNTDVGVMMFEGNLTITNGMYMEVWGETDDGDDLTLYPGSTLSVFTYAGANLSGVTSVTVGETNGVSSGGVSGNNMTILIRTNSATGSGTKTFARWTATDAIPPATNYATFYTSGNNWPVPVMLFDKSTTNQGTIFSAPIPEGYDLSSGITVRAYWGSTNTSGNVGWLVALRNLSGSTADSVWGTTNTITAVTVPGTATTTTNSTVNFSSGQLPSGLAAGSWMQVLILRDTPTDTLTGNAALRGMEVRTQ